MNSGLQRRKTAGQEGVDKMVGQLFWKKKCFETDNEGIQRRFFFGEEGDCHSRLKGRRWERQQQLNLLTSGHSEEDARVQNYVK